MDEVQLGNWNRLIPTQHKLYISGGVLFNSQIQSFCFVTMGHDAARLCTAQRRVVPCRAAITHSKQEQITIAIFFLKIKNEIFGQVFQPNVLEKLFLLRGPAHTN